jgi:hypothetical protein
MMHVHERYQNAPLDLHPRLASLGNELEITRFQRAPWDVFVDNLVYVRDTLDRHGVASPATGHCATLPDRLRVRKARLAAELEAVGLLDAVTDGLYRSLSPSQRQRADRLLPSLCHDLVPGVLPEPTRR